MHSYVNMFVKLHALADEINQSSQFPTPEEFDFLTRWHDIVSMVRNEFTVDSTHEKFGMERGDTRQLKAD
jgi:hypothetical protein